MKQTNWTEVLTQGRFRQWWVATAGLLCVGLGSFWFFMEWAEKGCIDPHIVTRVLGSPSGGNRPNAWGLFRAKGVGESWIHFEDGVRNTILAIEGNRPVSLGNYGPVGVPKAYRDPFTGLPSINRGCTVNPNLRAHDEAARATAEWYAERGIFAVNSARKGASDPNQEAIRAWAQAWSKDHKCQEDGSDAFMAGVFEVIDSIWNKKDISLELPGWPGLPDYEPEFGLPVTYSDCILLCQTDAKEAGKRQALSWYSERGVFPECSARSRIADSVPEQLVWTEFGKNLKVPDMRGQTLCWREADRAIVFSVGDRQLAFHRIQLIWRRRDKGDLRRSAWAWDEVSRTVFLRLVRKDVVQVFQIDFETNKVFSVFPRLS